MQIITKIEIAYFRSVYSASLNNLKSLNVLIGGNDAGKSNFLKALNLFFNNETELDEPYSFVTDITKFRAQEASDAKGRASIWIKLSFNNVFGWKSLPKKFTIKRSWNRYFEDPETTISPQKLDGKNILPQTITKFLNKISFYYVPAVRSRQIFSYYLAKVYDALLEDVKIEFSKSTSEMARNVESAVAEMSSEIKSQLGFDSTIQVPEDFRSIFESMDFSTKFGNFSIPLQNRGDGIQARHIPFILEFISKKSSKHHIWAYEEPENSLEMSKAFELAQQFDKNFSKENQIFITTHSPAFYDLNGPRVLKALVEPELHYDEVHRRTTLRVISDGNEPDISLGIADLIKSRAKEVYEQNRKATDTISELNKIVSHFAKPLVVTEGKTDAEIIKTAWQKLHPNAEMPFEIQSCSITDDAQEKAGVSTLKKYLESVLPNSKNIAIGIFDRDKAGKDFYKNLQPFKFSKDKDYKINLNDKSFALLLPLIGDFDSAEYWKKENYSVEFLFKKEFLSESFLNKTYKFKESEISEKHYGVMMQNGDLFLNQISVFIDMKSGGSIKKHFASNKVPDFPSEAFANFAPLLNSILSIISNHASTKTNS